MRRAQARLTSNDNLRRQLRDRDVRLELAAVDGYEDQWCGARRVQDALREKAGGKAVINPLHGRGDGEVDGTPVCAFWRFCLATVFPLIARLSPYPGRAEGRAWPLCGRKCVSTDHRTGRLLTAWDDGLSSASVAGVTVTEWPCGLAQRECLLARQAAFPVLRQEPTMHDEIQLISDGDGLAVIGNLAAVERFLTSE